MQHVVCVSSADYFPSGSASFPGQLLGSQLLSFALRISGRPRTSPSPPPRTGWHHSRTGTRRCPGDAGAPWRGRWSGAQRWSSTSRSGGFGVWFPTQTKPGKKFQGPGQAQLGNSCLSHRHLTDRSSSSIERVTSAASGSSGCSNSKEGASEGCHKKKAFRERTFKSQSSPKHHTVCDFDPRFAPA